jgi:hypothetical protein
MAQPNAENSEKTSSLRNLHDVQLINILTGFGLFCSKYCVHNAINLSSESLQRS